MELPHAFRLVCHPVAQDRTADENGEKATAATQSGHVEEKQGRRHGKGCEQADRHLDPVDQKCGHNTADNARNLT